MGITPVAAALVRSGVSEARRLVGVVERRGRERGITGFLLAALLCVAVLFASVLDHTTLGRHWIDACCGERDSDPLPWWLAKLPGSLVAPARDLPVWGSLVQLAVVFGIAEAAVGRRLALLTALAGHVVSTVATRVCLLIGPGHLLGLPPAVGRVLDTGPSGATVALTAYLTIVLRCPVLGTLAAGGLAVASLAHSDLAAREHITAWLVGAACGVVHLIVLRHATRRATPAELGSRTALEPSH